MSYQRVMLPRRSRVAERSEGTMAAILSDKLARRRFWFEAWITALVKRRSGFHPAAGASVQAQRGERSARRPCRRSDSSGGFQAGLKGRRKRWDNS
jgi:hypothetical protein